MVNVLRKNNQAIIQASALSNQPEFTNSKWNQHGRNWTPFDCLSRWRSKYIRWAHFFYQPEVPLNSQLLKLAKTDSNGKEYQTKQRRKGLWGVSNLHRNMGWKIIDEISKENEKILYFRQIVHKSARVFRNIIKWLIIRGYCKIIEWDIKPPFLTPFLYSFRVKRFYATLWSILRRIKGRKAKELLKKR